MDLKKDHAHINSHEAVSAGLCTACIHLVGQV
jgi:hypothetical protein